MTRIKSVIPVLTRDSNFPTGTTSDIQSEIGELLLSSAATIIFGVESAIVGNILNDAVMQISPLKVELRTPDSFDLKAFAFEMSNLFFTEFMATTGSRQAEGSLGDRVALTPTDMEELKERALFTSTSSQLIKGLFDAANVEEKTRRDLMTKVLERIVSRLGDDVFSMSRLMNQSVLDSPTYTDKLKQASNELTFLKISALYESVVTIHNEVIDRVPLNVQAARMLTLRENPAMKLCQWIKMGSQRSNGHEVNVVDVLDIMGVNLPCKEFKVLDHRIRVVKNNIPDAFDIRHVFSAASKIEDLVMGTHAKNLTESLSEMTLAAIKRKLNDYNTPVSIGYYAVNDAAGIATTEKLITTLFQYFLLRRSSEEVTGRFYSAIVQLPSWGDITRNMDLAPSVMKNLKDLDRCMQAIFDVYAFCRKYTERFKDFAVLSRPEAVKGDISLTAFSKSPKKVDINSGRPDLALADFTELENLLLVLETKHATLRKQNSPAVDSYNYMRSFAALADHMHPTLNSEAHYESLLLGPNVAIQPEIYFMDPTSGSIGGISPMFNKIIVHKGAEAKPRAFYTKTYESVKTLSMGGVRLNHVVSKTVDVGELDRTKSLFIIPFMTVLEEKLADRISGSVLPATYWRKEDGVNLVDSIRCAATKGFFGELTTFTSLQELREYHGISDDLFDGVPVTEGSTVADMLADSKVKKSMKEYLRAYMDQKNVLVYLNTERHTFYPDRVVGMYVYKRVDFTSNMNKIFSYCYYPALATTEFVLDKVTRLMRDMSESYLKSIEVKNVKKAAEVDEKSKSTKKHPGAGRSGSGGRNNSTKDPKKDSSKTTEDEEDDEEAPKSGVKSKHGAPGTKFNPEKK